MRSNLRLAMLAAAGAFCCAACARDIWAQVTVKSPDGKLVLTFSLKSLPAPYAAGVRPYYQVSFEGRALLADSPLGLVFDGAAPLDHDLTVTGITPESHDASWEDPINDNRTVRDHYNQLTVHLQERGVPAPALKRSEGSARRRLDIVFRAYDSGVAFRYVLLGQAPSPYHEPVDPPVRKFTLSSEDTGFYFARPAAAFALNLGTFTTPYEDEFRQVAL